MAINLAIDLNKQSSNERVVGVVLPAIYSKSSTLSGVMIFLKRFGLNSLLISHCFSGFDVHI